MSETNTTETTKTGAQPESATVETVIVSVDDAASLLGISPQAVRKRIAKGSLPAQRVGRSWQVLLERAPTATEFHETPQPTSQPGSATSATVANLQAMQLAALVEPFTTPLVARIEALSREAERERSRADQAEQERDELAALLGRVHAERDVPVAANKRLDEAMPAATTGDAVPLAASFWSRLWRALTDRA